ncbi:MAG: hypothetical protein KBD78_15225 [Oligoflexales bacterium]|nr:hypothetical protein [Oligoflexales bacterium]
MNGTKALGSILSKIASRHSLIKAITTLGVVTALFSTLSAYAAPMTPSARKAPGQYSASVMDKSTSK